MEEINKIIMSISDVIWDPILVVLLVGVGILFSLYLGFPQIVNFGKAFRQVSGDMFREKEKKEGELSSFQALATAVAAQIGTGNVAGVATAISSGGPGAVFWMWVSALFGMATNFSEAILAQIYREKREGSFVGGPAYYISKGLVALPGRKFLATFFSVALIVALGLVGNLTQSNSISSAIVRILPVSPLIVGIVLAALAAAIFIGGIKRIGSFAEKVVPFMAILYVVGSVIILVKFNDRIGDAFRSIFVGAFRLDAVAGGATGVMVKHAIRYGVARGLFSNEAGMGSTPHAHATADVAHPVQQGMAAVVGVFVDTMVVCPCTALVILVTNATDSGLVGALITQEAFTCGFGDHGATFLAVALTFFAFTTIVSWYYFGEINVRYLFGKKGLLPYRILVLLFIVIGSVLTKKIDMVWSLADFFNGIMVFPNMIALLLLAPQVKKSLTDYNRRFQSPPNDEG